MHVCRLVKRTEDGKPYLSGVTSYDLPKGSIVVLKRDGDEYVLVAVNDKRPDGDRTEASLYSFVDPEQE